MSSSIDTLIFVGFLGITLGIGLFYSRGIKNIREYAIGDRNFSTATIAATIIATYISGSAFLTDISEVYENGLFYIIPGVFGDIFNGILICYFIGPRMGNFLGTVSVAEAMGNLYGSKVRLITAISSTFNCIGKIAGQFKVSATILQIFFGVSSFTATLFSAAIVIAYSAFGGIKAVTFTDIIQFFTFGTIIPVITLVIWGTFDDPLIVYNTLTTNPVFDFREIINFSHPKFWGAFTLCLYFIFPSLNPAIFQRISMARDTSQVSHSFFIAAITCFSIAMLFSWIGILLLSSNPHLEPTKLFAHIIDNYTFIVGFKGLIAAGVMAMVMSTCDSYINAAAVTFSYDLRESIGLKISSKYDLPLSYASSIIIGILSFILAFHMKGLLKLFLMVSSFYAPIVSVPLLFAIFGFRTTSIPVLTGMIAGLAMVLFWRTYLLDLTDIDSVIPGILANLVFFMGSHYVLRQPGGWIGNKDNAQLMAVINMRKRRSQRLKAAILNFNIIEFCKSNLPKQSHIYSLFSLFSIVSVFSTMYSIPKEIQAQNADLIKIVYHTILVSSSILLTYPHWPSTFKSENFISPFWNISVPYILVFAPTLLVIASNFGQFQLMILMLNMLIISMLFRWQVAIFMISVAIFASIYFYKWFTGAEAITEAINIGFQFKIMYSLLLVSAALIAFLKPKQDEHMLNIEKVDHLGSRIQNKQIELENALNLKERFIRNMNHEFHAPLTGITSMAQVLYEKYDNLTDKQRKMAAETIMKSSSRLDNFETNLEYLAKIDRGIFNLKNEKINLSQLVYDRVEVCNKFYSLEHDAIPFILKIDDNIIFNGDKNYIIQTLDNLLINAIIYSKRGKITVTLSILDNNIKFSISDEGIGIPKDELFDIFKSFTVSSKTISNAGGRGVGLTVCEKVIKIYNGQIWAESDGSNGATFTFILPKN